MDMKKFEELLLTVQKPGRYVGGEWNAVKKEWTPDRVKFLLAFPDVYEIGMSNLGMKIIYGILNGRDDCLCERVFSPWRDFESVLRNEKIELFSLESRPLSYLGRLSLGPCIPRDWPELCQPVSTSSSADL